MSPPVRGWRPPICESRTGAAHLRRGTPCQDASGSLRFAVSARQPVQLLVVSDGHGSARYDRSDVGSQLACRVALHTAKELFCSRGAVDATHEQWSQWLAEELPRRIVSLWCRQVLAHAEAHPRSDGAGASITPYGATLGLLLLTPRWWGYTGLGDWDLVRLNAAGQGELVSEEPETPGGGEATYSLCMKGAERFFAARSGVHEISSDSPPFSLLLSSDGIRKSCGTDADFLILSHYLCGLPKARRGEKTSELPGALDHISSQGSGDDVSVAIGRWGLLSASERRSNLRRASKPVIVQPKLELGTVPGAAASAQIQSPGGESVAEGSGVGSPAPRRRVTPWLLALVGGGLALAAAAVAAAALLDLGPLARREPEIEQFSPEQLAVVANQATRLCRGGRVTPEAPSGAAPAGQVHPTGGDNPRAGERAGDHLQQSVSRAETLSQGRGISAFPTESTPRPSPAAGAEASVPGSPDPSRRSVDPRSVSPAPVAASDRRAVADLHRAGRPLDPDLIRSIRGNLAQRKSLFAGLQRGSQPTSLSLAQTRQDPLGALVLWSAWQPGLGPLANRVDVSQQPRWIPAALFAWLPDWIQPARQIPSRQELFPYCPELKDALREHWQLARMQRLQKPVTSLTPALPSLSNQLQPGAMVQTVGDSPESTGTQRSSPLQSPLQTRSESDSQQR